MTQMEVPTKKSLDCFKFIANLESLEKEGNIMKSIPKLSIICRNYEMLS